jgi:tyrosyl-tRNA synthetase
MHKKQIEELKYGCEEIIPADGIEEKLALNRPLIVKLGADPTAPHLHLGHAVVLRKLQQFQEYGHKVIFVVGDYTAMIGDPSGRNETRKPLTEEEVRDSARTYMDQVIRILKPVKGMIRFNSEWCGELGAKDIIKLMAKFTVARILERDDFTNRMREQAPIYLHEMLYVVAQAFDSVAIKADIEIGGTDQKFNFLAARDLQREMGMKPQTIITMPILPGTDGKIKMSKSIGNTVDLLDPPNEMFGKLMSIPDELILTYLKYAANTPPERLKKYDNDLKDAVNPRDVKLELANIITDIWHENGAGKKAQQEFLNVFSKNKLPKDIKTKKLSTDSYPINIADLITTLGMCKSKSEARRLIKSGAVKLDNKQITDIKHTVAKPKENVLIKVGKRRYIRLVAE